MHSEQAADSPSPAGLRPESSYLRDVTRWTGDEQTATEDLLVVEEPLQIRLAGEDVVVTMRTPGNDLELAAGFLLTEGVIGAREHIDSIAHCPDGPGAEPSENVVNVQPSERRLLNPDGWGRNFYSTSSCGLCGKTSIDQLTTHFDAAGSGPVVSARVLYSLPDKMRAAQQTFEQTGGLHAAALFDTRGVLLLVREDIGRHNAVDKVVGHALLSGMLPLDNHLLLVSSRASFEIVQKALVAGVRVMAVVSAPSTLAVDLARQAGMTLVAFLREDRLNVYSGEERIEG